MPANSTKDTRVPAARAIALSLLVSASTAAIVGALAAAIAGRDPAVTAQLAAITAAGAALIGATPIMVSMARGTLSGFLVLAGSLLRLGAIIAIGVIVQITAHPAAAPFWAALIAAWLAAKLVEALMVWPRPSPNFPAGAAR